MFDVFWVRNGTPGIQSLCRMSFKDPCDQHLGKGGRGSRVTQRKKLNCNLSPTAALVNSAGVLWRALTMGFQNSANLG